MDLFAKLPENEVSQLHRYLDSYSGGSAIGREHMDHYLRYWNDNKINFYRMFGEQFILRKEVLFEKPFDELEDEMDSAIRWGSELVKRFCKEFKATIDEKLCGPGSKLACMRYELMSFVDNMAMLVDNCYNGDAITIPAEYTATKRAMQINKGCKVSKMVGKISDALGIKISSCVCPNCGRIDIEGNKCPYCGNENCEEKDGYEAFRQAHSLVLNQKKIKGTLCLSIHPLDFLTMSDNDCGWTSCMSWMEEAGDYRMGTVEMMNSPCVVIAYIEAKDKMWVCGNDWSNKRWRQLYIVTPELILGNRQYPFESDVLQGAAIKWLRDLANPVPGYGPYAEEASQIRNNAWNTIGDLKIHFNLYTSYMYNDVYDCRLAYVAPHRLEDENRYDLCFSGPAVCASCGDDIEYDTVEAHNVICRKCDGHWRCDCCGDYHSEYDSCYEVGDYLYCDWCYHNELESCECCGDCATSLTHIYIQIPDTDVDEIKNDFNFSYYVGICDDCLMSKSYEKEFGPIILTKDTWGCDRRAFSLDNMTDYALECGDLSSDTVDFLKSVRDEKSIEGRLNLIRQFSY